MWQRWHYHLLWVPMQYQCSEYISYGLLINGFAGAVPLIPFRGLAENKKWCIIFFLSSTILITLGPWTRHALLHSIYDAVAFIRPVNPSLASYIAGLPFNATRFPEGALPVDSPRLAWLGGGSHALWHIFIVRAISLHRDALPLLKDGVGGSATDVCYFALPAGMRS